METTSESLETSSYIRFILEIGSSGTLLDLSIAMLPCILGYGQIGSRIAAVGKVQGNLYQPWIDYYASEAYQIACVKARESAEKLMERMRITSQERLDELSSIFIRSVQLEVQFWDGVVQFTQ
ncbi:hypothetical protein HDU67_002492 [Dinochytrium kinnereticum]|nr:hypothetical protein HDU67_002492 [Dinochytrium kinnereticum]